MANYGLPNVCQRYWHANCRHFNIGSVGQDTWIISAPGRPEQWTVQCLKTEVVPVGDWIARAFLERFESGTIKSSPAIGIVSWGDRFYTLEKALVDVAPGSTVTIWSPDGSQVTGPMPGGL